MTIAWWSIVLFSSGDGASGEFTRRLLHEIFGLEGTALDWANLILRKTGHVMYYAILTGLLSRSFRNLAAACILALGTSLFDEARQHQFASRTGTWVDLLYDGVGIGLTAAIVWWRATKRRQGRT